MKTQSRIKPTQTKRATVAELRKLTRTRLLFWAAGIASIAVLSTAHAATPTLTAQDVGYPTVPGSMTTAAGKTTIVGGGNDIWGTADNFHYAFFKVTGDFDYIVKVEDLQGPDNWTKAELMARLDDGSGVPQGGDPHISNMTTRSGGQNELRPQWRVDRDGNSDNWAISPAVRPAYPNTWLRLERIGSVFYQYYSTDGTTWKEYTVASGARVNLDTAGSKPPGGDNATSFSQAWPNTVLLGLAVTAHNDGDATGGKAIFSGFAAHVTVPIAITTQPPATLSLSENKALALSIAATGDPVHYQWRKNGMVIPGATSASYSIAVAKASDSGTYTVRLYGAGQEVISANSVVTITQDTEAPKITSAAPDETFTQVVVTYSEPIGASAENRANYALDKAVTVSSVSRVSEFKVKLTTSKMAEGTDYALTVTGVQDTATPPNTIAAGTKINFKSFVFATGYVLHKFWDNITANNIAGLTGNARFPDSPTLTTVEPLFEYGPNGSNESGSNYGNQLIGWFTPQQTGNYVFFTNSDDPSNFYLSTDDNPANKKLVAQESGWSNARNWVSVGGGSTLEDKRSDSFAATEWPNGNIITLQAGKRYYIEALHTEGGGGDSVAATFKLDTENDPVNGNAPRIGGKTVGVYLNPNGASVTIAQQPQNTTVFQNRSATFAVTAKGASAYGTTVTYQWQTAAKGSSAFTDIAGATLASYTTPLLAAADDGRQYRVMASVPTLSQPSDAATVTINVDKTPPTLVSAGAISGDNQVGVAFSELLDQASAETAANYQVSGATVSKATLHIGKIVRLDLAAAAPTSFTVTANGVKDAAGNPAANATVTGELSDMKAGDMGNPGTDPLLPGDAFAYGAGGYYVAGGGHDIWDNADGFQYVYKQFTGAFDMRANVLSLNGTHQWAKAELMARETLAGGSRHADVAATRSDGNGQNQLTWQWRDTTDGASGSLAGASRINLRDNANYPNTWIRLVRESATANEFKAYWSKDGKAWNLLSAHTIPSSAEPVLPATLYVGMAVTSHDNADTTPVAQAIYGSFTVQPFQAVFDPQLKALLQSGKVVISWASGTLVASPTVTGNYLPVSGASSPYSVTPQGGSMFFKVQP